MKHHQTQYQTPSPLRLYIEHTGEKYIGKLLKAVEKAPWGITLLQLAWTAGPVTFLALQGGYYIGYGKAAPLVLFIYFAGYTLIAGLIGVLVNVTHKTAQNQRKKRLEADFLFAVDKLADLMIHFCNFRLNLLTAKERKYEAACILLKNSHPLPSSIATAVDDVTNDKKLAQIAEKIEIFRRSGLFSRMNDLIQPIENQRKIMIETLTHVRPELSYFLNLRLQGKAPSLKDGIPRPDGFLERIFLASQTHNLTLMTIRDAEALLTLIFEFINGREIYVLNFRFTGNKELRQAANTIEKQRSKYRLSQIMMDYRTQALKSLLIKKELIPNDDYSDLNNFYQKATECIDTFSQQIMHNGRNNHHDDIFLNQCQLFLNIILRYTFVYDAYKNLCQQEKQYLETVNHWKEIITSFAKGTSTFRHSPAHRGLRIAEKVITLDDEEKLACAKKIASILQQYNEQFLTPSNYSEKKIKQLTISIALAVDPMLNLSNPINQYGIESSNAANLGSLEQGISVQAKIGWSTAMVKEVGKNSGKTIEKLAKVLIQQYGEKLDDEAIDFLHRTYGANKNTLNTINKHTITNEASSCHIYHKISAIKGLKPDWLHTKIYAQNILPSHGQ